MAAPTPVQKWLGYFDPQHGGRFAFHTGDEAGYARFDPWMQFVFAGRWWMRIKGGHNLRRRSDRKVPTLADPIVCRCDGPLATMTTPTWVGHDSNTNWVYLLTSVGAGGVENQERRHNLEVVIVDDGILLEAVPRKPVGLSVVPSANGSFDLTWFYNPTGQGTAPTQFFVYSDSGTGTIDYGTPVATITYDSTRNKYSANSGILAGTGDTAVLFVVRSALASGEEKNAEIKSTVGRTTAPYATLTAKHAAAISPVDSRPTRRG